MRMLGSRKPIQPQSMGRFYKSQEYDMKIKKAKDWLKGNERLEQYKRIANQIKECSHDS
mgnify:CR=1 FL=1|tara:strand:- start:152 stop:328 length:177 start_codon:yes stop_codon:yes gene_type:complete